MGRLGVIKTFVIVAAFAATYFVFQGPRNDITNHPSSNTGVVVFGDSLVAGVGSARGGGFVRMLSEELGLPIVNLGVSGDTTKDALKRVYEVARRKPAITIVLLGGNDFLNRVPEAETLENLAGIIESIHNSGSAIILVGLQSGVLDNGYKELFQSLSDQYKTAYVPDILNGIFGNTELMSDSLHPNDAGYRVMTERIRPVLQKLLYKN